MKTLAIDTSNQTLAVAVLEDGKVLGQFQTMSNKNHSVSLMPAIDAIIKSLHLTPKSLDRIVVAQGPGSYTGLRIGVTTAKTLAETLELELVGVSSLKVVAANCPVSELIVPIFDARRSHVYVGGYRWENGELQTVLPDTYLSFEDLAKRLAGEKIYFVGQDVAKYQDLIKEHLPQARLNQEMLWDYPNGVALGLLGEKESPVSIHDFVPHYLKLVEAEEKWLASHEAGTDYVEKI